MTLNIYRVFNPNTKEVEYQSVGSSNNPAVNEARVNLSRGGTKLYRLDSLHVHNGRGAYWDGEGIHSDEALEAYVNRCDSDIIAAIDAANANASPFKSTTRSLVVATS